MYDWDFWARPNQKPPEWKWQVWLLLAGRGFGKTRTGAEFINKKVWNDGVKRIAIVAETPAEARDVLVEGQSGLLNIGHPSQRPIYEASKRRLTWSNGATATIYSGANPELLRGPEHELAWVDELAKYRYPQETWDNLMMGLRLGDNPQVVVTTTPKPIPIVKEIMKDKNNHITRGSTFDNKANLPKKFLDVIMKKYDGTRLGRQELYAEILDDNPNALWKASDIENARVTNYPHLQRIVIGVDPAVTSNEGSDETGIIAAGKDANGEFYVLDDKTLKGSPTEWAKQVVALYHKLRADRVIGETNNGGDMIEMNLRNIDNGISYRKVHATKGKYIRAEPISALYEQGRVHHVGNFKELEDELTQWEPGMKSPNRLDALVWALTSLNGKKKSSWGF